MTEYDCAVLGLHDNVAVELSGGPSALTRLAALLRSSSDGDCIRLVASERASPSPYPNRISALTIDHRPTMLALRIERDRVRLTGSDAAIFWLCDSMISLAEASCGGSDHLHLEHYPHHPFVSPSSAPLVLSLE